MHIIVVKNTEMCLTKKILIKISVSTTSEKLQACKLNISKICIKLANQISDLYIYILITTACDAGRIASNCYYVNINM